MATWTQTLIHGFVVDSIPRACYTFLAEVAIPHIIDGTLASLQLSIPFLTIDAKQTNTPIKVIPRLANTRTTIPYLSTLTVSSLTPISVPEGA